MAKPGLGNCVLRWCRKADYIDLDFCRKVAEMAGRTRDVTAAGRTKRLVRVFSSLLQLF